MSIFRSISRGSWRYRNQCGAAGKAVMWFCDPDLKNLF